MCLQVGRQQLLLVVLGYWEVCVLSCSCCVSRWRVLGMRCCTCSKARRGPTWPCAVLCVLLCRCQLLVCWPRCNFLLLLHMLLLVLEPWRCQAAGR